MAELGDLRKCIRAIGGDADFRPRLLVRLRRHFDVFEAVILALVGEGLFGPRFLQDFERLGKALAAFTVGHAVGLIGARETAAPDPENQPSVADLVDRRRLLRQSQRVTQRQDLHPGADLHAFGAGGNRAGQRQWRRTHRAFRRHVNFGKPHRIQTPAFSGVDLLEGDGERLLLGHPGGSLKLMKHTEFESHHPFSILCTSTAC